LTWPQPEGCYIDDLPVVSFGFEISRKYQYPPLAKGDGGGFSAMIYRSRLQEMITFNDFKKLDIRVGKILSADKVDGTDKLIKLEVDFGAEKRQLVAGIAEFFEPDNLIGKEIPVLMNLEPRSIRGIESQGMILAIDVDGKPVLLLPEREVPPGSIVR